MEVAVSLVDCGSGGQVLWTDGVDVREWTLDV